MQKRKPKEFTKRLATLFLVQEGLLPREYLGLSEVKKPRGDKGRRKKDEVNIDN